MTEKRDKCERRPDDSMLFCWAMTERGSPSGGGKGFRYVDVIDLAGGDISTIGVSYHRDSRDKGTVLNHCPWCGEPLIWEAGERKGKSAALHRGDG